MESGEGKETGNDSLLGLFLLPLVLLGTLPLGICLAGRGDLVWHSQLRESRGEIEGVQFHVGLSLARIISLSLVQLGKRSVEAPYRNFQGLPPPSQEGVRLRYHNGGV